MSGSAPPLRVVAWEITRNCSFRCRHCRADAHAHAYRNELSTAECVRVLESIASFSSPIVILTGGEPMSRPDLFTIVRYGSSLGLRIALAPCGPLVTAESAAQLKEAGVSRISLSMDGSDAATHDRFRGVPGAYEAARTAIGAAKAARLPFQINSTIGRFNRGQLGSLLAHAIDEGAAAFHPFFLVPVGRGRHLAEEALRGPAFEEALTELYELSRSSPIPVKPTCAPHYYRILREREKAAGRTVTLETHGSEAMARGCIGGKSFAFISHRGALQICGFLEQPAGNVRSGEHSLHDIWERSPFLQEIRNSATYGAPCGSCSYVTLCGGCRARAFAISGSALAGDPDCEYRPQR